MSKHRDNKRAQNNTGVRSNVFYGNLLDQKRYIFSLQFIKNKSVLDCACGVGWGSYLMSAANAKDVLGIDISDSAIYAAKRFYSHNNVNYRNIDLKDFKSENKFDVVTCFETIEHVSEPIDFLKNIYDLLADNGTVLLSTPNAECFKAQGETPKNPYHIEEYSIKQLTDICNEAGFVVTKRLGQYLIPNVPAEIDIYRKFIAKHWVDVKRIQRYGSIYKLCIKFRDLFLGKLIDPALGTDCVPVEVPDNMNPAYNFLILAKGKF